jgi:hypothetical protein
MKKIKKKMGRMQRIYSTNILKKGDRFDEEKKMRSMQ